MSDAFTPLSFSSSPTVSPAVLLNLVPPIVGLPLERVLGGSKREPEVGEMGDVVDVVDEEEAG